MSCIKIIHQGMPEKKTRAMQLIWQKTRAMQVIAGLFELSFFFLFKFS